MKFELDSIVIEESCRHSELARRVLDRIPGKLPIRYVEDGRVAVRPLEGAVDQFGSGKRNLVLLKRRAPFLMGCPAGSNEFACCGYLVMILASNCPMDCSYCFLQEYVADNPALQIYTNYPDVFAELDRLRGDGSRGGLRIGTGELADSLAFDTLTGISVDLVDYFSRRSELTLELKTKTDEIENLLKIDPKGRTIVSWTLSPERIYRSSEHRTAAPSARIAAAGRVLDAGYKVAFHFDPIIGYPEAGADYVELLDQLFSTVAAERISFVSLGGLRMTPSLRTRARARFPRDPMLLGEEVLTADGRYRTFTPLRFRLYAAMRERIARANSRMPIYLCMETPSAHRRIFGDAPLSPSALGARLASA